MVRGVLKALVSLCVVGGAAVLFGAYVLNQAQTQVEPAPEVIPLAEFLDKGDGANAHVELTGVFFGKPVVEKSGSEWRWVWLPLYEDKPPQENAPAPQAIVRVGQIPNKAALEQFVQRTSVSAVVCARMPERSPWNPTLPGRFTKNFPTLKAAETILLTEPDIRLATWSWGPETLFDPLTLKIAWGIGGGAIVLALVLLLVISRLPPQEAAAPAAKVAASVPDVVGDVAQERAISQHVFNRREWTARMWKLWVFQGFMGIFLVVLFTAGFVLFKKEAASGLVIMVTTAVLGAINYGIYYFNNLYSTLGVAEIEVCPSGLRWRKTDAGPLHFANWTQMADLEIKAINMVGYGMMSGWRLELTITWQSGERLKFAPFTLTDYLRFAKLVEAGFKQRRLAATSIQGGIPKAGAIPLMSAGHAAK